MVTIAVVERCPTDNFIQLLSGVPANRVFDDAARRLLRLTPKLWLLFCAVSNAPSHSLPAKKCLAAIGVSPARAHLKIGRLRTYAHRISTALMKADIRQTMEVKTIKGQHVVRLV
jgi:hypothetical protein